MDPKDRETLAISEEIEIQTTVEGRPYQFKIKPKELSGHFDLGMVAAGSHWINPYVGVKVPRASDSLRGNATSTLGLVFHHQRGPLSRLRGQLELAFQEKTAGATQIDLRTNVSYAYRNCVFSVYELWSLSTISTREAKVSAAGALGKAKGFAQLDLKNIWKSPSYLTLGVGYQALRNLGVYAQLTQDLAMVAPAVATEPAVYKKPNVSFGVDYAHCKGFGAKVAIDLDGKVSKALNFTVNKVLSGSLLFDVTYG